MHAVQLLAICPLLCLSESLLQYLLLLLGNQLRCCQKGYWSRGLPFSLMNEKLAAAGFALLAFLLGGRHTGENASQS